MNEIADNAPLKIAAIRAFIEAGFVLVPTNGKIPVPKDWQNTAPGTYAERELAPGNYGVVLKAGDLIVDVDPRNFPAGDNVLRRLIAAIGPLSSFTVRTGGGGLHIYLRKPADILVRNGHKDFPGIEFKSAGRQVIAPGSIHPDSGKLYEAASGTIHEIADAPASLLALIKRTAVPFAEVGTGTYVNDANTQGRFLDYLERTAEPSVEGKGGDHNAFRVAAMGRDLALPPDVTWELMLEVWNPRCSPPWDAEELKAKVVHAYVYASGAVGSAHPAADFAAIPAAPSTAAVDKPAAKEEISWDLTAQGAMKKSFVNLMNYLKHPEGGLVHVFGHNEFTGRVEFMNPAPWHRGRLPRYVGVGDHDLKLLKGHLAKKLGFEKSVTEIEEAITVIAHESRFHPVREYLDGLKWDGTPRLDTWLHDFLGAPDNDYVKACARKTLCAAVMRIYRPGCKFDSVLLLEGPQGIGKSSVCKILGGPWAADFPIHPHDKDTIQNMQGRWFLELAELEVTRRTDMDALKAFITRSTDQARLAYGRTVGEFPRQSVFIGSKNPTGDETYLKDDENRRWWPVACAPKGGQFDFKGLKEARNQLFAEAVMRVKTKGEHLYMETAELKEAARDEAGLRRTEHEWTERIAQWVADVGVQREHLTTREIYVDAMGGLDKQLDRKAAIAIATVMRRLGWAQGFKRLNGHFSRVYLHNGERVLRAVPISVSKEILDVLGDLA